MYSGLLNLIISSFAGGIEVVYFSVVKNEIKKKIKKLDLEINSDVVLKKQKIKELEQIKSKKCDISKLNIIKNDPISIVKKLIL